jgi:hypothetical protein
LIAVTIVAPWMVLAALLALTAWGLRLVRNELKAKDKTIDDASQRAAAAEEATVKAQLAVQIAVASKDKAIEDVDHRITTAVETARRAQMAVEDAVASKNKAVDEASQRVAIAEAAARRAELAAKAAAARAVASRTVSSKPGPWGPLEYRAVMIDLPEGYVYIPPADQPPVRWFFHGASKDEAIEFLKTAGITPAQVAQIEKAHWQSKTHGVAVEPGDEFILALSADARGKIYSQLVEYEENSKQIDPVWFRKGQVDKFLKDSDLSPSSLELLNRLLYRQGESLLLFADFEPVLRRLRNDSERQRFMNSVSRKQSLLVNLRIEPDSDLEAIIDYCMQDFLDTFAVRYPISGPLKRRYYRKKTLF